jgi:RNA polymerase-binding transcription factor DksA
MDSFADDNDRASFIEEAARDAGLDRVRQAAKPEQQQNEDGSWPVTECQCGEPIEEGRLALGKIRCIECQTKLEQRRKNYV